MSLLKDLDDPKSSKYTFSDFWSDFSWDSLQNKVDQAQKEMDDRMQINFKNINKEMYTKTTIELLQKYRSYYESVFKKTLGEIIF